MKPRLVKRRTLERRTSAACLMTLLLLTGMTAKAQVTETATVTLEGQLVCSLCWFEADRKITPFGTPADIECAKDCAEKGIPPAVAVKSGDAFKLYVIEEGGFKKNKAKWLDYLGKQVRVSGQVRAKKDKEYISVDELKVLSSDGNGAKEVGVIGAEVELGLKDLFGVEQKLSAYRGKIVVLNFWATWCIPCRKEMPDLAAIQNEYAALGVQVVGAAADTINERSKVLQFIKKNPDQLSRLARCYNARHEAVWAGTRATGNRNHWPRGQDSFAQSQRHHTGATQETNRRLAGFRLEGDQT